MTTGQVTLDGRPLRDAEVLKIDGSTPTALVRSDAHGVYTLPAAGGDRLVLRVCTPVVGVWVADAAQPRFDLARSELIRIRIDIHPPEGVAFDWLDLKLTPRREEVPPRVILAAGVEPGLHEGMFGTRMTEPHLEVDVRPGLYDLRAHRIVETGKDGGEINLIAETVVSDGPPATPRFGGFEVQLGAATKLSVRLRRLAREEL